MPKGAVTVIVPAGQSISSNCDLTSSNLEMILVPASIDGGPLGKLNLSFQFSADGTTFYDLIHADGSEVLTPTFGGRAMDVPGEVTNGALYLRIRTGSRDNPIVQTSDRTFVLITV